MNKKGTVIHWIVFGIVLAVGLFFSLFIKFDTGGKIKGEWQMDFLQNNVLPTEAKLAGIDAAARKVAVKTAKELALDGGFKEASPCGQFNKVNRWNVVDRWCLPEVEQNFISMAEEKLSGVLPILKSLKIKVAGGRLRGEAEKVVVLSKDAKYVYDPSFVVDIGSSLQEYQKVQREARSLVDGCRNRRDLATCVREKEEHWKYISCTDEQPIPNEQGLLSFCVESGSKGIGYNITLDFTPTGPLDGN